MKKIFIILGLFYTCCSLAGTLFITAKEHGQPIIYFEHAHVRNYGWNAAGTFVVILNSGQEILYGRRSDWDMFNYAYVADEGYLRKD